MAADSDGTLTAVVICEGNLHDPEFPKKFRLLLGKLRVILQQPKSKKLKVNKVEPWNSVRVTLSIPKDAAAKLRQLAAEGSTALRALGILSVQLEGDTVISLRLVGQEIVLRTDNNFTGCAQEAGPSSALGDLSRVLANPLQSAAASCSTMPIINSPQNNIKEPIAGPSSRLLSHQSSTIANVNSNSNHVVNSPNINNIPFDKPPIFKSPNTICPMDGKLPVPPVIANATETREYPFESMTQARVIQRRENTMAVVAALSGSGNNTNGSGTQSVNQSLNSQQIPSTSQQQILISGNNVTNQQMIIGSSLSPAASAPPPLTISGKPLVVSQSQQQTNLPQEQTVKSQFVQPPPPPYPNIIGGKTVKSLSVNLPVNSSLSSSNSNNIAISSPLLVNLLQNDGMNPVKPQHQQTVVAQQQNTSSTLSSSSSSSNSPSPTPGILVSAQQQQQLQHISHPLHQNVSVPSLKTAGSTISQQQQQQPAEIMLNPATGVINHVHQQSATSDNGSGALLQNAQIIVNNSVVNQNNNINANISLNPSMPVPSTHTTISNVSHPLNQTQSSPHHNQSPSSSGAILSSSPIAVVNNSSSNSSNSQQQQQQSILSQIHNIRMQQQAQPPQQQRFALQAQQQLLLRQQQIVQMQGNKTAAIAVSQVQKFHPQNPIATAGAQSQSQAPNPMASQQFRYPLQQNSPQQQFVTPPPSPHPNAVNHSNITVPQQNTVIQQQQQQIQQQQMQIGGISNYNQSRWPFKPMDSATKSSYQEFARYQMQYNLQQQQISQAASVDGSNNSLNTKNSVGSGNVTDPLGLGSLADLDELTKNDLESLLPGLNVNDLDSALGLDGKNTLESLLDANNLDLDLIDQDLPPAAASLLDAVTSLDEQSQIISNNNSNMTNTTTSLSITCGSSSSSNSNTNTNVQSTTNSNTNRDSSLTRTGKQRQYLINPLTGELEPMPSDESESESELAGSNLINMEEFNSEMSNSVFSDDENSCSTGFSKTSDHSDTERSTNSETSGRSRYSKNKKDRRIDTSGLIGSVGGNSNSSKKSKSSIKNTLLREKLQQGIRDKISGKSKQPKEKMTKAKLLSTTATNLTDSKDLPAEKIKLRLKLEKSEPVTPAYKVDVSFVQSPKRAQTAVSTANIAQSALSSLSSTSVAMTPPSSSPTQSSYQLHHHHHQQQQQQQSTSNAQTSLLNTSQQSPASEELRVPPLHISLRGKNSVIIKNSKKDRKKSQTNNSSNNMSINEDADNSAHGSKKSQTKKNHNTTNYNDIGAINALLAGKHDDTSSNVKNHHLNVTVNRSTVSHGKPSKRQSNDTFSHTNSHVKSFPNTINQVIENGENSNTVKDGGSKLNQLPSPSTISTTSNKRNVSDLIQNPNGLIYSETKRRKISQQHQQNIMSTASTTLTSTVSSATATTVSSLNQQQQQRQNSQKKEKTVDQPYTHLKGPIGSTNVGTLPQHATSSFSKNQKSNIGNTFSNKISKNLVKTGKPLAAVVKSVSKPMSTSSPSSSSSSSSSFSSLPPANVVKDPGKSPPVTSAEKSNPVTTKSTSTTSGKSQSTSVFTTSVTSNSPCLLPQDNSDTISEEKFKQKLLELHSSENSNKLSCSPLLFSHTEADLTLPDEIFSSPKKSSSVSPPPPSLSVNMNSNDITSNTETKLTTSSDYISSNKSTNISNAAKIDNNENSPSVSLSKIKNEENEQNQKNHKDSAINSSVNSSTMPDTQKNSQNCAIATTTATPTISDITQNVTLNTLTNNGVAVLGVGGNVRNSPGSQAQGEDSGIESMDALSEKSPHQSSSPQQNDHHHIQQLQQQQQQQQQQQHQQEQKQDQKNQTAQNNNNNINNNNNNNKKDSSSSSSSTSSALESKEIIVEDITNIGDIEAALAKMEGINDHFLISCESPSNEKFNGEMTIKEECLLKNLTAGDDDDDDDTILSATSKKLKQVDDALAKMMMDCDDLINDEPPPSKLTKLEIECCDMNENKEISKSISLETQIKDECCKNNLKSTTTTANLVKIDDKACLLESLLEQKKYDKETKKCNKSLPSNEIKTEKNTLTKEECVTTCNSSKGKSSVAEVITQKSEETTKDTTLMSVKTSIHSDGKEVLTPISIEIPNQNDSETPRVRTRASSKLESPLDAAKQSPHNQLDSPATSVKSNLRVSTTPSSLSSSSSSIDRLSPKILSNNNKNNNNAGICANNSASSIGGTKRKRQGSESSVQSCVSDDTPGKSNGNGNGASNNNNNNNNNNGNNSNNSNKRSRQSNSNTISNSNNNTSGGNGENIISATRSSSKTVKKDTTTLSSSTSSDGISLATTIVNKNVSGQKLKKIEESSDSDEPLIEVVGKVRNSKYTSSKQSLSSVNHLTGSSSLDLGDKNLRNHRIPPIKHSVTQSTSANTNASSSGMSSSTTSTTMTAMTTATTTITSNTTTTSAVTIIQTQSSNSITKTTSKNPINNNSTVSNSSNSGSLSSSSSSSSLSTSQSAHSSVTNQTQSSSLSNTHSTRATSGTVPVTGGNSSSSSSSSSNSNSNSGGSSGNGNSGVSTISQSTNSPTDDKIGTRRSVRASAAANKIIYSRGISSASDNNNPKQSNLVAKVPSSSNNSIPVVDLTVEPRRKTRSGAAVIDTPVTVEGRRRRGSRDGK